MKACLGPLQPEFLVMYSYTIGRVFIALLNICVCRVPRLILFLKNDFCNKNVIIYCMHAVYCVLNFLGIKEDLAVCIL